MVELPFVLASSSFEIRGTDLYIRSGDELVLIKGYGPLIGADDTPTIVDPSGDLLDVRPPQLVPHRPHVEADASAGPPLPTPPGHFNGTILSVFGLSSYIFVLRSVHDAPPEAHSSGFHSLPVIVPPAFDDIAAHVAELPASDTTAPAAPTTLDLAAVDDTGRSNSDGITRNTSGLTISGTGETGATVTLFDDVNNNGVRDGGEAILATTTIAGGTAFTVDIALAPGLHHIEAFQIDAAGNVSTAAAGLDITVDTTAPSAPTGLDLAAADDTGSSNTDNVTGNTSALTISGTGETGATVTLFDDVNNNGLQDSGESTLATTTIASGTAFTVDIALTEGLHHVAAVQTDPAGNLGSAATLDITVDTTAPVAPAGLDLAAADDSGSSNSDDVTGDTSGLTISGTGETGATVTLFDDVNNNGVQDSGETTLATTTIASGTTFSADIALAPGLHHVGAFQTDIAGNVSTGAAQLDITMDTTAPAAPTGIDLAAADDTGSSNADNVTSSTSALTVSGSGETGATVTLFDDVNNNGIQDGGEATLATTTIASGTAFSADIALAEGVHHVGAFQTDPAGTVSGGAARLDITVDTTAPAAPTGLDLAAADDTGSSNTDNVTSNASGLTISGIGETGATVTLFDDVNNNGVQDGGETTLATTTIASGTAFSADIALAEGLHHVAAVQTDPAGNLSTAATLNVTVDATAPAAPTGLDLATADDTGSSNSDNVTSNTSALTISGSGETGATVTLFDDANNNGVQDSGESTLATTTIASGTAFTADIALTEGLHHVSAVQTDPAGNLSSAATLDITVDTMAPAAPNGLDLAAADDTGSSNSDNVTSKTSGLTISGSGETGATVTLFDDANNNGVRDGGEATLATTTIASGTAFSADIALAEGLHHVTAVQTDPAGNVSSAATLDMTVDTTAPTTPTGLDLAAVDDTGPSSTDNITSGTSALTISGAGETGATVTLFDDVNNNGVQEGGETTLASTTIASGTAFSADIALAEGLHHVAAVQTDAAGNLSSAATLDITVDSTAPAAPTALDLAAADDTGSSSTDNITSTTSGLTISGAGETGATVTLFDDVNNNGVQDGGETTLATTTIASGTAFTADIALTDGLHHVATVQTDPAGNLSGAATLDITVDSSVPAAPSGLDLAAADDTGSSSTDNITSTSSGLAISGAGETGATVTLFDDANYNGIQDGGETTLATTTIASGTAFSADIALTEGLHHVAAVQTDPAGNVSSAATLDITVDTAAPAAPTSLDLAAADDTGSSSIDNVTSNTSGLTISGSGETGATVTLFDDVNNNGTKDGGETTLATITIASGTAFSADIALAEGLHHVAAVQTDPAGNRSSAATLDVTVDTTAPSAPTGLDLAAADDTGSSSIDNVTSNTSGLTISGSGETGATVTLFDDANNNGILDGGESTLATTTITSGTAFSLDVALNAGLHHVAAVQTDPAGNISSAATLDITVDTSAPAAPTGLDLATADDTGSSSIDNITKNISALTISGSGETGATVTLFDDVNNNGILDGGETTLATTTIASGTAFSADIALAEGLHHVAAIQTDPAGNRSSAASLDITVDTTAPAAPSGLDLATADDTGSSSTDNVTSNTSALTISGTGETGATVTLFDDANNNGIQDGGETVLATTTIASGTAFSADISLAAGLHHVGAFQTDVAGNVSTGAARLDITVDTSAPAAPTGLDLATADDTGSSSIDNITKNTSALTISGSGETGATVTLFDDVNNNGIQDGGETTLATIPITSGTAFSADIALAEGLHHVAAVQTDPAGNRSSAATLDITVDTTAPAAPTGLDLATADDTGSSSIDNITSNTSALTISGVGETGATVTLFDDMNNNGIQDGGETTLITTTIASGTAFSADISLAEGLHHVAAVETDPAGNRSNATSLDITVDTTTPATPTGLDLATVDDTGSSSIDNITKNTSALTISGSGETGATVTLFDDANSNGILDGGETTLATIPITSGTAFSADITLAEGLHHVAAVQTDTAGNRSGAATLDITVDTTAPAAPASLDLAAADDTGSSSTDNITSNTSALTISGTGENGATVLLFDDVNNNGVQDIGETTLATTIIASGTAFNADIALAAGTHHIGALETDAAGNVSTGAARLDITVDTTAPSAPTGLDLAAADDTGSSSTDNITKNTSALTISGTGETGATVTLFDDVNNNGVQDSGESTLVTTTIASGTAFSADITLTAGTHHVGAFQTDVAGNVSTGAARLDISVDTSTPAAPTGLDLAAADDTGSSSTDNVTKNTSALTISGSGETGATITLFDDANNNGVKDGGESTLATTTIASGTTFTADISLAEGLHHIGAVQTDVAGNVSTGAPDLDITVDTTIPFPTGGNYTAATKTLLVTAMDVLSGVDTIKVTDTSAGNTVYNLALSSGTALNGTWTGTTATNISGHSVSVTLTDLAGNTFTTTSTAPAGTAGSPINLALHDPSGDHVGPIALTVTGMPDGWTLSEGTNNGDGTWSVVTNDVGALTVTAPGDYSGALVLDVKQSWTNADGSTGQELVLDNVEAYAPGSPIFAWSGLDTLTGSTDGNLFVFGWPIGDDVVHDFDAAKDKIDLIGFTGLASFEDVAANLTTNAEGDAVLNADGTTITLIGVSAEALAAGNFVFNQEPANHISSSVVVSDGAMLPLSGIVENMGTISLESSGDRTDLEIIGTGLTLTGGGHLTLSDSDANVIHGTGTGVQLTNVDNIISGAGQLGEGQLALVNHGTIVATGDHALTIDTGSNAVVNDGTLESTGHGGLKIDGNLVNSGQLWAHGGDITVSGDVTGGGSVTLDGHAVLDIWGASDASIGFGVDAAGFLRLTHSSEFTGTISGFNENDSLGLRDIGFADKLTLSYADNQAGTGGLLTVSDGAHTANIAFEGQHATADFHAHSDGGAGTLITVMPPELA